ncbi:hypothetical protein BGZ63DRAFT_390385 [Mariannaea sp. PMI_226]|nr:hypothetical protein BGZ63DRAFT_390385 [Mariannaea sp. PMI_226]
MRHPGRSDRQLFRFPQWRIIPFPHRFAHPTSHSLQEPQLLLTLKWAAPPKSFSCTYCLDPPLSFSPVT